MSEIPTTPIGVGGTGELLDATDDRPRADIRLVRRAIREGWGISPEVKSMVVNRLKEITEKKSVMVPDVKGEMQDRPDIADNHAISAARVLVAIDTVDQTDHWNADKNDRLDRGQATERVANVLNVEFDK